MSDPLQTLLNTALDRNQFGATSRYVAVPTATLDLADGSTVTYLRRRFAPSGDAFTLLHEHPVRQNERLDHITGTYLGDPEQFWRICDANDVMDPLELVAEPGRVVKITLPEGFGEPPDA